MVSPVAALFARIAGLVFSQVEKRSSKLAKRQEAKSYIPSKEIMGIWR